MTAQSAPQSATQTPTHPETPAADLVFDNGTVLVGSCLDRLKELPDCSVDAVVTDPPYEIAFMGKGWDNAGIAFNKAVWGECLRVLKPGGHLLAFGATRTYHRIAVAIEDAGFEIRDSIHWTYGSGFPKSLNVGKALEAQFTTGSSSPTAQRKAAMGADYKETPLAGTPGYGTTGNFTNKDTGSKDLELTTPEAQQWSGWGTALKPSHEPIVVARKPLTSTVAANVLEWGTGALNIDASRVGRAAGDVSTGGYGNAGIGLSEGIGTSDNGKGAEWVKSTEGRFPANTILTHSWGCEQAGTHTEQLTRNTGVFKDAKQAEGWGVRKPQTETVPASHQVWQCVAGCPVAVLDQQSGFSKSPSGVITQGGRAFGSGAKRVGTKQGAGDSGGASRFFTQTTWTEADDLTPFLYVAKPSKRERNAGLDGLADRDAPVHIAQLENRKEALTGKRTGETTTKNNHPTVKPQTLMAHLLTMVTPPGGVVLDPFLGSGTTAVAATLNGFQFIGCELTAEYLPIIEGRVRWAHDQVNAPAPVVKPARNKHVPDLSDGLGEQLLIPMD